MKYYLYISDSKLDMLLPSVSNAMKENVAAEFKVDLKLFSASYSAEQTTLDNSVARLQAVERHILRTKEVGTIAEPKRWVRDRANARLVHHRDDAVFFAGAKDQALFGLGGSRRHMTDSPPCEAAHSSALRSLSYLGEIFDLLSRAGEKRAPDSINLGGKQSMQPFTQARHLALEEMLQDVPAPEVSIEFLAVTFFIGDDQNFRHFVGSPLYVALSDQQGLD